MSNKKIVWGIAIVVIIVLIVWAVWKPSADKPAAQETIKIGVIAPVTGGGAVFGASLVGGVKLAQQDLSGTKFKYEVLVEDDGTNSAQSASAAQKLINLNKVQALITITSGTGNAVKPMAAAAKIPHICVCADTSVADNSFNFTNSLVPKDEAVIYVAEAKKHGYKTLALWSQIQPGIDAIMSELEPALAAAGMKVVYKDRYEPTIRDFRTSIQKGMQAKPDTFFILAFPPTLDIIGQQFKDLGVTKVSAVSAFGISANPKIFEGYWYTDANLTDAQFQSRFEAAYPAVRFNVRAAPYGYDSFRIFVDAFESGKPAADYIRGLASYNGKVGISTKPTGTGIFHSPADIWTIKDGKSVPLAD